MQRSTNIFELYTTNVWRDGANHDLVALGRDGDLVAALDAGATTSVLASAFVLVAAGVLVERLFFLLLDVGLFFDGRGGVRRISICAFSGSRASRGIGTRVVFSLVKIDQELLESAAPPFLADTLTQVDKLRCWVVTLLEPRRLAVVLEQSLHLHRMSVAGRICRNDRHAWRQWNSFLYFS